MDTLEKLFTLQQSLSKDLSDVRKLLDSAKSPAATVYLKSKYNTIWKLYQQVSDIILPY